MVLCIWWKYGIYEVAEHKWTYGIYGILEYLVLPSCNAFMHTYLLLLTYFMRWFYGFAHMVQIRDIWDSFIHMMDI